MSITLRDIAKMAGVSTATVSRVLNNKAVGNMRTETYERIKRIIEIMNYTPHALASGLRSGVTKLIGVILPSNVNPYYAQLGNYIESEAFENGYLILICNSNADVNREKDYIRHLISQRVSGILLCSTGLSSKEIKSLCPKNFKVILLDEEVDNYDGDIVIGDDSLGGYKGAQYLYEMGHRNILLVTGPENLNSCRNRFKGFLELLHQKGQDFDPNFLVKGEFTIEGAYRGVKRAINLGLQFSAVFSFNDLMAIGAIKALNENDYVVPDDISVLGYDNIFIDEVVTPEITTVATPLKELGERAVHKLIDEEAKTSETHERILLEPKLIIRDSCTKSTTSIE